MLKLQKLLKISKSISKNICLFFLLEIYRTDELNYTLIRIAEKHVIITYFTLKKKMYLDIM